MIKKFIPMLLTVALVLALVSVGSRVSAADPVEIVFSTKGYTNAQEVPEVSQDGVVFKFDKGTNTNAPKYYDSGTSIRTYKGNTIEITAENNMTGIEFVIDTGKTGTATSDPGSMAADLSSWTGSASKVTITVTDGQFRIVSAKITFGEAGSETEPSTVPSEEPTTPTTPTTPEEIVNAAYALETGKALDGTYTLTGVVTKIVTAYSERFGNVTVDIQVGDMADKPIRCFRLVNGADVIGGVEGVAEGDTVTVTGKLLRYSASVVEFDAACTLDAITKAPAPETTDEPPVTEEPATPTTPEEIVKAAYALETGKALTGNYTLTGVVTKVVTEYSERFGNVTVDIQVDDMADKPIRCFRMVNGTDVTGGVEGVAENDTITVTGKLLRYSDSVVEFDAACTLDAITKAQTQPETGDDPGTEPPVTEPPVTAEPGTEPPVTEEPVTEDPAASKTPEEIVNDAYALADGEMLAGTYTLTGVVTKINTPYSSQHDNITVTIQVGDMADKLIQCFRLTGEGNADVKVDDTITVSGSLKNYRGTIEFDAGCLLIERVPGGNQSEEPVYDTPEKVLDALYALGEGEFLGAEQTLTGKIVSIDTEYSQEYGNVTVTIVVNGDTARPVMCYRLAGDGADNLAVNDVITVKGPMKNHYGTYEFAQGCVLENVVKAQVEPPTTGDAGIMLAACITVLAAGAAVALVRRKKEF